MANDFSREIKQWNAIAAGYERKRANLRPISFDFTSKAYSNSGNYNGASTFNSARAKLMADDGIMRSRMTYDPPAKAGTVPTHNTVLKPSADVVKLAAQNDKTENKIKELGGNAFRGAVSGLMRAADLISRTGYAIRSSSMTYAKENAADGSTTVAEHAQNALAPIFDIATMVPRVAVNAATGDSDATYKAMWDGFSGRTKTSGHDLMKVAFPQFTSDHKKWTSVLSFGVDVVYDPLSWITVGQGTVVSGGAKAVAAGGAAAVGKKTVARNLMANTVFTTTGRKGGMDAVRADLYARAGKPYLKQNAKAGKAVRKETKQFEKVVAKDKWNTTAARSQFTRVEKAKKVRDDVVAKNAAKLAAVQAESFDGMQLAWKAVARKSLGIASVQSFGKGVNTAGTAGRAAREFKALQTATHEEILNRFKSPTSQESHAWRKAHQDLIDSGKTSFTYTHGGKTKTFNVAEDYDQFVDEFGDIAFPRRDITEVTKKDRAARRSLLSADDAEAKKIFTAFNEHLDLASKRGSADLVSPYRGKGMPKAPAIKSAEAVKQGEQMLEGMRIGRQRLVDAAKAAPGETDAMAQLRIRQAGAEAAQAKHVELLEQAAELSKTNAAAAAVVFSKADAALAAANDLLKGADEIRATAEAEHAAIMDSVNVWMTENGMAIGRTEDEIVASLAARSGEQDFVDQLSGKAPGSTHVRDTISASAQAKVDMINQAMAAKIGEVVTEAGGTMKDGAIADLPGMMPGSPVVGGNATYSRQINYEIAKAIQEVHELVNSQEIVEALHGDYELAWDAIQQNTNYILNSLFGDSHMQIFTYLNDMGYSILADAPHTDTLMAHVLELMGDTFTPMEDALKGTLRSDLPNKKTGKPATFAQVTKDKLLAQIPQSLQRTHTRALEGFRNRTFSWKSRTRDYNAAVELEGVANAIDRAVDNARILVSPRNNGTMALPIADSIQLAGSSTKTSVAEVFAEWLDAAQQIMRTTHTTNSPALGHYSLYDYWTFGTNTGKETQAVTDIAGRGKTKMTKSIEGEFEKGFDKKLEGQLEESVARDVVTATTKDKAQIGRAGYLHTRDKIKATLEESGIINEALDTIPAMDDRMLELTSHVRGWLAGGASEGLTRFPETLPRLRSAVAGMLVPDLQKIATGPNYENVKAMDVMRTLGAHVYLLSDTTMDVKTSAQVALASEVWGRSTKIRQLNESIMLFNLHNTLTMAMSPEKAAAEIAKVIANRPNLADLMAGAKAQGTTNGALGVKAPPATDIGHIRNQAAAAAEEAAKAWDTANPVKTADTTIEATKGKHTDAVLAELEPVRAKVDNPPIAIADKLDSITEEQAMSTKFLGERNKMKIYSVPDSDIVVVRAPTGSDGKNFTFVMTKDDAAIAMKGGKFTPNAEKMLGVPLKYAEGDNDDFLREFVVQISGAKNGPSTSAVDDAGRATARQAEYDRVYAAKMEELKPAAVVEDAGLAAQRAALSEQLSAAKIAKDNAIQGQANAATVAADAKVAQANAAKVKVAAEGDVVNAEKAVVDAQATDARVTEATTPVEPDRQWNQPGGFFTPEMSDAAIAEIDMVIADLLEKINVAKINESIEYAQVTLNQGMADYAQKMREIQSGFDVNTRYMLKFAGIPIMPIASAKSPVAAYAGVVGMKESQSRVANWIESNQWSDNINRNFRRPSSMHDSVMNDMRNAIANNAQNMQRAMHKSISSTYNAYKSKAALRTDVKAFWDKSMDVPIGLAGTTSRLQGTSNTLFARAIRGSRPNITNTDRALWSEVEERAFKEASAEQVRTLNAAMPFAKLPESALSGETMFNKYGDKGDPYSREWLLNLSEYLLRSNYGTHPLAKGNVDKINMAKFEDALQTATNRIKNTTALHDSMFDHFTFAYSADHVKVLNESLPKDLQYVPLNSMFNLSNIYGDTAGRYVAADIAREMQKVSDFTVRQTQKAGAGAELSFTTLGLINNHWKAMVTAWSVPRYHIGNVMSDGFLSMLDGVGVNSYRKASQVMVHQHEIGKKLAADPLGYESAFRPDLTNVDVNNANKVQALVADLSDTSKANAVSHIRIQGQNVTLSTSDYYKAYVDYGLAQTQVTGNLDLTHSEFKGYAQAMDKVMELSNVREDYFRMAHFVHAVENEALIPGRTQQEIFKAARDRVVKYHFDYGDVSEVERLTVGRFLPFYKWTRNIVPLALTQLVTNPKAYIINNAANKAMGEMMYPTQEDANGNTIPLAYITPDFVGDSNMVPIGQYTDPEGNEQARYAVLNLPLDQALVNWIMPFVDPFFDPTKSVSEKFNSGAKGVLQTGVSSSHPLLKSIINATTGQTVVPGDSFENMKDPTQWLTDPLRSMLPGVPILPGSGAYKQHKNAVEKGTANSVGYNADLLGFLREKAATEGSVRGQVRKEGDMLSSQLQKEAGIWMQNNFPDIDPKSEEGKKVLHDFFVERGVVSK